ncbi:MAG TPA: hypothetical protein VNZ64_10790 [Candidatus Acidoferrum sp.]|nr:hypothetical protein [Candidatus Acidoferrum sp.]
MPDRGLLLSTLLVGLAARGHSVAAEAPSESGFIRVATAHSALVLYVGDDKRLYELAYGASAKEVVPPRRAPSRETKFHPAGAFHFAGLSLGRGPCLLGRPQVPAPV